MLLGVRKVKSSEPEKEYWAYGHYTNIIRGLFLLGKEQNKMSYIGPTTIRRQRNVFHDEEI